LTRVNKGSIIADCMTELDVSALIGVQQAIRILDSVAVSPHTERVSLLHALGRRLAQPIAADRDCPPFHRSQMDGYAVRSVDVATTPIELQLIGEIAAGVSFDRTIEAGQAVAIMTGAPLPAGADGVVPIENTRKLDELRVLIERADNPARMVALRGSDCRAGKVILDVGVELGPTQIAAAAFVGAAEVEVFQRPRVAVLSTGNELVGFDETPGESTIRDSNGPMLVALLTKWGCDVTDLGRCRDEADVVRASLQRGLAFDALFVTGGMSMGAYDFVPKTLVDLGVELKITKLRIKPGKPFVFGVHASGEHRCFVFGLPGNPVSAFVCASRFASRVIDRIGGGNPVENWLTGRLNVGLPANGPREFYQPATRIIPPGRDSTHGEFASISPLPWVGSADLFTLARANALIVRPENDPPLPKGTVVRVLSL
jgi:molybdopterin molybdotransferase